MFVLQDIGAALVAVILPKALVYFRACVIPAREGSRPDVSSMHASCPPQKNGRLFYARRGDCQGFGAERIPYSRCGGVAGKDGGADCPPQCDMATPSHCHEGYEFQRHDCHGNHFMVYDSEPIGPRGPAFLSLFGVENHRRYFRIAAAAQDLPDSRSQVPCLP